MFSPAVARTLRFVAGIPDEDQPDLQPAPYDPRDQDSGPHEAVTPSYNDPTSSGTLSTPLPPQEPSYQDPTTLTYPPAPTEPPNMVIQPSGTPPTPGGDWQPVQTVPKPDTQAANPRMTYGRPFTPGMEEGPADPAPPPGPPSMGDLLIQSRGGAPELADRSTEAQQRAVQQAAGGPVAPRQAPVYRQEPAEDAAAQIERQPAYEQPRGIPTLPGEAGRTLSTAVNESAKSGGAEPISPTSILSAISALPFDAVQAAYNEANRSGRSGLTEGKDPLFFLRDIAAQQGVELPSAETLNPEGRPASVVLAGLLLSGILPDPLDPAAAAVLKGTGRVIGAARNRLAGEVNTIRSVAGRAGERIAENAGRALPEGEMQLGSGFVPEGQRTPRRTGATRNAAPQFEDTYDASGARSLVAAYEEETPARLETATRQVVNYAVGQVAPRSAKPEVRQGVQRLLEQAIDEGEQMLARSKVVATGVDGRAMDALIDGEGFTNKFAGVDDIEGAVNATWEKVGKTRITRDQAREFTMRELGADQMILGRGNMNGRMYAHVTAGPPQIAESVPVAWFVWDDGTGRITNLHHHYAHRSPNADIHKANTPEGTKAVLYPEGAIPGSRIIQAPDGSGPLRVGARGTALPTGEPGLTFANTPYAVGPSGENRMRVLAMLASMPASGRDSLVRQIRDGRITDPKTLAAVLLRESSGQQQPAAEAAKAALGIPLGDAGGAEGRRVAEQFRMGMAVNRNRSETLIVDPNPKNVRAIYMVGPGREYLDSMVERSGGVVQGTKTRLQMAQEAQRALREKYGRDVPIIFKDTSVVMRNGQPEIASGSKLINDAVEILPDGTSRPISAEQALAPGRADIRSGYMSAGFSDIGSGYVPTMSDARNAAQGAFVGAASPDLTDPDAELTPQERLARAGMGAVMGVAAGRGMRSGRGAAAERRLGSGMVPEQPRQTRLTVEVLRERMDKLRGLRDDARATGDTGLEADATRLLQQYDGDLQDALSARSALEPRIRSDVGQRMDRPITEAGAERTLTQDAQTGFSGQPARPDELSGPVGIPTDMTNRANAFNPGAAIGAGAGTEVDENGNPVGVDPWRALTGAFIGSIIGRKGMNAAERDAWVKATKAAAARGSAKASEELAKVERAAAQQGLPGFEAIDPLTDARSAAATVPPSTGWQPTRVESAVQRAQGAALAGKPDVEPLSPVRWMRSLAATIGYNSMLGPSTFSVNVAGNMLEPLYSAPKEWARAASRGNWREAAEMSAGGFRGFMQTAGAVKDALAARGRYASNPDHPMLSEQTANPVAKKIVQALEAPGRLWSGVPDAIFGTIARSSGEAREAAQMATDMGLKGQEWKRQVSQWLTEADKYRSGELSLFPAEVDRIIKAGEEFADKQTFRTQLGEHGKKVQNFARVGGLPVVGNMVTPFFPTPWNMGLRAAERTPIVGALMDTQKGFDKKYDQMAGTVIFGSVLAAASQGQITGSGPADREKRQMMIDQGWQPKSTLVMGYYIPNRAFGIFGPLLDAAGETHDALAYQKKGDGLDKLAGDAINRYGGIVKDQPYLQGIADILSLLDAKDPIKAGQQYAASNVTRMIPFASTTRTLGTALDPKERTTDRGAEGFGQRIQSGVGLRGDLPVAQNTFGEEKDNPRQGAMALLPKTATPKQDPALKVFQDAGVDIGAPKSDLRINDDPDLPPITLTPAEQRLWNQERGKVLRQVGEKLASNPKWKDAPPDRQQEILKEWMQNAADTANQQVKAKIGADELRRRVREAASLKKAS